MVRNPPQKELDRGVTPQVLCRVSYHLCAYGEPAQKLPKNAGRFARAKGAQNVKPNGDIFLIRRKLKRQRSSSLRHHPL